MSEARETRAITTDWSLPGLLWLSLGIVYLTASASGYHGIALGVLGLMIGAVVANTVANSVAASSRRMAGLIVGLMLASAGLYWSDSLFFVMYMPPVAGFAFMAFFFQRTLRGGSEPLITRVARKEHPNLPLEILRYTRTLTWIWTWCFVFLFVTALLLAPVLPLHSWSRWIQGLAAVVPAALLLGEYIYRHHHLRDHHHASLPVLLLNIITVIKEAAVKPAASRLHAPGSLVNIKQLPLARYRTPNDPVLLRPDGAISAAAFFSQVHHLAAALPESRFVINLCETRHGFMLGFAAALLRGQTSLLPSGQGRGDWEQVLQQFPDAWLLSEKPLAAERVFDISPFLVNSATYAMPMPLIDSNQTAAVLFTSGSTGQPTSHPKTWGQLCHGAASLAAALDWGERPSFAIVGSVPSQHMFGLETTVMLPWVTGVPIHAQKPLLPADLDNVLRHCDRPSWWMTTPMHLRTPPHSLRGLAGVVASTMSLPVDVARAAETAWQVPVMEIYGSTETGALAVRRTAAENLWTPLSDVSLWREDEKILATGPHVGLPVAIGDELKLQPDGRFLWIGRATDLIKVGGKRASLSALNQNLTNIPGVDDGVYFSPAENSDAPHPAHRMAALYVSATLTPHEVLNALRTRIDPVFVPRPLYRVAQLPRNAMGKLPQAELAKLFAQCRLQKPPHMNIPADHPALSGHFPGNPIVPGVVILARVTEAIGKTFPHIELNTLLNTRFHASLKPRESFCIEPQLQDDHIRFKVRLADSDVLIASGQWQYRPKQLTQPRPAETT